MKLKVRAQSLIHGEDGMLLFSYSGSTRYVCDDGFDDNAAKVACYELYGSRIYTNFSVA